MRFQRNLNIHANNASEMRTKRDLQYRYASVSVCANAYIKRACLSIHVVKSLFLSSLHLLPDIMYAGSEGSSESLHKIS